MSNEPLRHRVERTRNKHSRAVCQGDTIVIRLARNLSAREEREHIVHLLRRMTHLMLEERRKQIIHPFRPLLDGGQSLTVRLHDGRRYHFVLKPAERTRATRTRRGWTVEVGPRVRRSALHRLLWKCLIESERGRMTRLVHDLNLVTYRAPIREVRVRFASSQWGSCSASGTIMLNPALLFVPASLMRYVVIHELAHRRVTDHSPRFWDTVATALPRYKSLAEELKTYRLPPA